MLDFRVYDPKQPVASRLQMTEEQRNPDVPIWGLLAADRGTLSEYTYAKRPGDSLFLAIVPFPFLIGFQTGSRLIFFLLSQ